MPALEIKPPPHYEKGLQELLEKHPGVSFTKPGFFGRVLRFEGEQPALDAFAKDWLVLKEELESRDAW